MPIHSLRRTNSVHRAGIIRLGGKVEVEGRDSSYPVNEDHFVLTDAPDLKKEYGEKPRELVIVFTSDDIDLIAAHYLQYYKCRNPKEKIKEKRRNELVCKGKGVDELGNPTVAFWNDTSDPVSDLIPATPEFLEYAKKEFHRLSDVLRNPSIRLESRAEIQKDVAGWKGILDGKIRPRWCRHQECPDFDSEDSKCKAVMTMSFKVPLGDVFGEYILRTGSYYAINNVNACIEDIKKVTGGRIAGIPLTLSRRLQQVPFYDKKKKARIFSEKWVLHLEVNKDAKAKYQERLRDQIAAVMLEAPATALMLPSPNVPGASVIDEECPEDLYPTAEERGLAEEMEAKASAERAAKTQAEQARRVENLNSKEDWLKDPEVMQLLLELEKASGGVIPEGKRRATVKSQASLESFKTYIRGKIKACQQPSASPSLPPS